MKCSHCGGFLDETDKRCPYCNAVNENYKAPESEKPAEPVAPTIAPVEPAADSVPVSKVVHIYHSGKKPQKKWVKILKRVLLTLILTGVGLFVAIAVARFITFLIFNH